MNKFLIQPTVFNYYSAYTEWLELNGVSVSVLTAYEETGTTIFSIGKENFLNLVLTVLLEARHTIIYNCTLVLCKDNKGRIFLLNKSDTKPFFKVSRF